MIEASSPRRRPKEGGYARGNETRERLVAAAMRIFAAEGFAGASTRRIAAEAGVSPPVLQYYFDSKEGLHQACGELLVNHLMSALGSDFSLLEAALADNDTLQSVEALCALLRRLSELGMAEPETSGWKAFLTRIDTDDGGPARAIVEQGLGQPLMDATIAVVARALGLPPQSEEARVRALLIAGQLSAVVAHRQRTLEAMGWAEFDPAARKMVGTILDEHVRRLLRRDI